MNTKQTGKTQAYTENKKSFKNQPTRWQESQKK